MKKYSLIWILFNVHGLTGEEYAKVLKENSMKEDMFLAKDGT